MKPRIISFDTKEKKEPDTFQVIIPECCRKNLDSCTHKVKRDIKSKNNVGM